MTFPHPPLKEAPMLDLNLSPADFSATTVSVSAETEAGKSLLSELFGAGAVSVELRKSYLQDFCEFAERKGLKIA